MDDLELADVLANCPFHTDAGSPAIYRKVPEVIAGRIIAALRCVPERSPSGEMVAREPTTREIEAALQAGLDWGDSHFNKHILDVRLPWHPEDREMVRAMLSAAEAEGRKS